MPDTIDFQSEIDELLDPANEVSPGELEIWGGHVPVNELAGFLETWDQAARAMEWRIREYPGRIKFTRGSPSNEDLNLLERARIFGEDGDLSLRRDGDRVLWHFVGRFEPPDLGGTRFSWDKLSDAKLRRRERTALLWGKQKDRTSEEDPYCWQEDRVGRATLEYPLHCRAERLALRYTEFSDGGQVAFVWWKDLTSHEQRQD